MAFLGHTEVETYSETDWRIKVFWEDWILGSAMSNLDSKLVSFT
jgi:hypothetical protein